MSCALGLLTSGILWTPVKSIHSFFYSIYCSLTSCSQGFLSISDVFFYHYCGNIPSEGESGSSIIVFFQNVLYYRIKFMGMPMVSFYGSCYDTVLYWTLVNRHYSPVNKGKKKDKVKSASTGPKLDFEVFGKSHHPESHNIKQENDKIFTPAVNAGIPEHLPTGQQGVLCWNKETLMLTCHGLWTLYCR